MSSKGRIVWIAWALALAALLVGLGWQVVDAEARIRCAMDERLVLCSGPLDAWLLPASIILSLSLVGLGAWRLIARA